MCDPGDSGPGKRAPQAKMIDREMKKMKKMKKKRLLFTITILAALLSACTRSDRSTGIAGGGAVSASASGSGNAVSPAPVSGDTAASAAVSPENSAGTGEAAVDGSADQNGTYDIDNQSGDPAPAAGSGVTSSASGWDGVYVSGAGETLTMETADEWTLRFSFAVSGISGTADVEGSEAGYQGDDAMDVTCTLLGDTIQVSVTNAETGEIEETTVTGEYRRQ